MLKSLRTLLLSLPLLIFYASNVHALDLLTSKASYIEVVIYKPKKGVTSNELNKLAIDMNQFLKKQKGFVFREYAVNDKGEHIDIVYWNSKESADNAQLASQSSKACAPAFEAIDMNSMIVYHFDSKSRFANQGDHGPRSIID